MNNYVRILAMSESDIHCSIFSNARKEAGINLVYDPDSQKELYQVFIHNLLPYQELSSWFFESFTEARLFAAKTFASGWELLKWDFTLRRKCGSGDSGCGTGGSCGTSGGGCGSGGGCSTKEGGGGCGSSGGGCSSPGSPCHID